MERRSHHRTTRRRSRPDPAALFPVASAFAQDTVAALRPSLGFLSNDRLEFLKSRTFDLLEDYGVVVVHPAARTASSARRKSTTRR